MLFTFGCGEKTEHGLKTGTEVPDEQTTFAALSGSCSRSGGKKEG
jgi:hypothetical protein